MARRGGRRLTTYEPHDVDWTPEKIGRFWDDYGADDSHGAAYFSFHAGAAIAARAAEVVPLAQSRVLDFGSGRGDLLAHLFARGIPGEGFEFSEDSAEIARRRFADEPLFHGVAVSAQLPSRLPDTSYDAVFLVEVLEHLLDDQLPPTLDEVHRVLAPGGHVIATTPNEETLAGELVRCPDCGARFHRWQHQRSFSADSISRLFADHGFQRKVAEATNWSPPRGARLRRLLGRPAARPHLLYVGVKPAGAR